MDPVASQSFRMRWIVRRLTAVKATILDTECEAPNASMAYLRSTEIFLPRMMMVGGGEPSGSRVDLETHSM